MPKLKQFLNEKSSDSSTDATAMLWLLHISTAIVILVQELINPGLIPNHWVVTALTCTLGIIPFSFILPRVFRMLTIVAAVIASVGILNGFIKLLLIQTDHSPESLYTMYVFLLTVTPLSFFTIMTAFNHNKQRLIVTFTYYILLLLICGYFLVGNGPLHTDSFLRITLSIFISSLTALIIIFFGSLFIIQRKNESRLRAIRKQSFKDTVTQLANRTAFHQRLNEVYDDSTKDNNTTPFGLMLIDIDSFKAINDYYGSTIGDQCLKIIAARISALIADAQNIDHENSLVARTDGDEFALLFPIQQQKALSDCCQALKERLSESFLIGDLKIQVPFSISACSFEDAREPHLLLQKLDWAMQEAKLNEAYCVYDQSLGERMAYTEQLKSELAKAIEQGEFLLHFQPLVNLHTERVESAEALLRWNNAHLGNVSPADFIPIAEQSGLILAIGQWVIDASCLQLRQWLDAGFDFRVAVNISVAQFRSEHFIDILQSSVSRYGIDTSRLELEITESLSFDQIAFDKLLQLQELGYTVKLDDFGTGYSSLSVMSNLPLNALKIDRAFVQNLDEHSDIKKWMMVKTIIDLAQNFQLDVIAEGVETQEQLLRLKELGCDYIQGFFISRPIAAEDFEKTFLIEQVKHAGQVVQPALTTQLGHLKSAIN